MELYFKKSKKLQETLGRLTVGEVSSRVRISSKLVVMLNFTSTPGTLSNEMLKEPLSPKTRDDVEDWTVMIVVFMKEQPPTLTRRIRGNIILANFGEIGS